MEPISNTQTFVSTTNIPSILLIIVICFLIILGIYFINDYNKHKGEK